jgi:hypothetical protein
MDTILRAGPVIASGLDDQRYGAGRLAQRSVTAGRRGELRAGVSSALPGAERGCLGRGRRRCVVRRPHFRHIMSCPPLTWLLLATAPRAAVLRRAGGAGSSPICGVTSSGRRMVARPPSSQPPRGTGGNWLRSTAVAPQSSRRPRLTTTSRVSCWRARRGRPARAARGCGVLAGHRGSATSYLVEEAGGLVAGRSEDGFVGEQRHGRAP